MTSQWKAKIKLRSPVWVVLVCLLVMLQIAFPYRGWLILLIALGSILGLSYLWMRLLSSSLYLVREMRYGWASVGDSLEERFQLIDTSQVVPALWVEVTDLSTLPDRAQSMATGVGLNDINSWLVRQTCSRRGLFTLGPTNLRTGDPFGIFDLTLENPATATLLVLPPVLPLPPIEVAGGGRAGEGRPALRAIEQTINVNGVRGYVDGDSLRWIHWPTSARRDSIYIKTFDNTPISDWWIFVDLEQRSQVGSGPTSTEETAVVLGASLASRGIKQGLAVGLVVNGSEAVWLPPRTGETQRLEILQKLAVVSSGSRPVEEMLINIQPMLHMQSSLVFITASADDRWLVPMTEFMRRGVIPTVLLLDRKSFGDKESTATTPSVMQDLNIASYVISQDFMNGRLMEREATNMWEWRVMGTGKAVPVHKPGDMTWKSLS